MKIKQKRVLFCSLKKPLLILMRTFIFLCFTAVFSFTPSTVISQNFKIKIEKSELLTVDQVFDLIKNQTDYKFLYQKGIFDNYPKVKVEKGIVLANDLLSKSLSKGNYIISVEADNTVLVKPNNSLAVQQKIAITGLVTDVSGIPLTGASILEKGTLNGVQSNFDGVFKMLVSNTDAIIVVSYLGYKTQEIAVESKKDFTIVLEEDSNELDEVVVVGYGSQRKELVTNAISKMDVSLEKLRPTLSPSQLLEGRIAGVQTSSSSGNLGAGESMRIRGTASLSASTEPLYVIDGVPITNPSASIFNLGENMSSLATLSLTDIESITVLKDAASAAIYGSRATNGVVVITTKRGKEGKSRLNINLNSGFSEFANPNRVKFADSDLYLEVLNEGINNFNEQNGYVIGDSDYEVNQQNPFEGLPDTDWLDLITQTGTFTNLDLSFSGGNKKTNFYLGGNYSDREGIIKTNKIKKLNAKATINHEMFPWLTVGTTTSANYLKNYRVPGADIGSTIIARAVEQRPYDRVYKPNGDYYVGGTNQLRRHNPIQILNEQDAYVDNLRFLGNYYVEAKLAKNLSWKTSFNADALYTYDYVYYNENHPYGTGVGRITEYNRLITNVLTENILNYDAKIANLVDMSLMAGHSFQKIKSRNSKIDGRGYPSPSFSVTSVASEIFDAYGSNSEYALESYFGRATFSYQDKYIINSSLRTDGSSKFSKENRWAVFPSISFGWNIANEDFMKDSTTDLKFRASYGETGNQEGIGNYSYQPLISGGYNYGGESGIAVGSFGNEDLTWETTNQFDVGLDLGFWNGKVNMMFDYYVKKTNDLLYNSPIHTTSGTSAILSNVGSLENKGFEFSLNTHFNLGELQWNSQFNIATNKNQITSLNGEDGAISIGGNKALEVGKEIGSWYIFEMEGIYQYDGEVPQQLYDLGVRAGDVKWRDLDGNNVINDNDRVVMGSPTPDFYGGWNNTFKYKGFQLDVFTTFSYGNDVYATWKKNGTAMLGYTNAILEDYANNRWTGPGTSTEIPRAIWSYNNYNSYNSNRWLEDGSYLRLRTLTLSYNFKPEFLGLDNLRVYAQGDNLLLFTKYSGWDPEVNVDLDPRYLGEDNYSVPQPKTISVGVNIAL